MWFVQGLERVERSQLSDRHRAEHTTENPRNSSIANRLICSFLKLHQLHFMVPKPGNRETVSNLFSNSVALSFFVKSCAKIRGGQCGTPEKRETASHSRRKVAFRFDKGILKRWLSYRCTTQWTRTSRKRQIPEAGQSINLEEREAGVKQGLKRLQLQRGVLKIKTRGAICLLGTRLGQVRLGQQGVRLGQVSRGLGQVGRGLGQVRLVSM